MGSLRRMMRVERLESRALLAANVGIPDIIIDPTATDPQVVASIEIENAAGIRGATVEIQYDQRLLQADMATIRAGSIWDGKGVAIANVNDQDGTITAFIFATQDMSLSRGSLLDIDFMFNDEADGNARANIGLSSLRINEGSIPISELPIRGQSAIDGSITRQGPPTTPTPSAAPTSPPPMAEPPVIPSRPATGLDLGDLPAVSKQPHAVSKQPQILRQPQAALPEVVIDQPPYKGNPLSCMPSSGRAMTIQPLATVDLVGDGVKQSHPLAGPSPAASLSPTADERDSLDRSLRPETAKILGGEAPAIAKHTLTVADASLESHSSPRGEAADRTQRAPSELKELRPLANSPGVGRRVAAASPFVWLFGSHHDDGTEDIVDEADRRI